jgi:hypothetical protein
MGTNKESNWDWEEKNRIARELAHEYDVEELQMALEYSNLNDVERISQGLCNEELYREWKEATYGTVTLTPDSGWLRFTVSVGVNTEDHIANLIDVIGMERIEDVCLTPFEEAVHNAIKDRVGSLSIGNLIGRALLTDTPELKAVKQHLEEKWQTFRRKVDKIAREKKINSSKIYDQLLHLEYLDEEGELQW